MPLDETLLTLLSNHHPAPQFPPAVVDRILLTTLGFNEIQSDILLLLWESGGELPIWGDGSTPDLCHELDMRSATIRQNLKPLQALEIVTTSARSRAQWVKVVSPSLFGRRIASALVNSAKDLSEFFALKQKEFLDVGSPSVRFANPIKANIPRKLVAELVKASQSDKVVFGVVTTSVGEDGLELRSFRRIRCQSGEKIHYKPDWGEFHAAKRKLVQEGQGPLVEFHSHPNGTYQPNPKDIEKMKMLRRGYWMISGKDGLGLWCFYHEVVKRNGRYRLHIDALRLVAEK
ncbi:MAG: hypothetical protein JRM85_05025 [Nitrososphaerota archaeon]|jgi:proteasome lid subunit RPN8/RPN11|nr:hypothetical protein [Nitrososphaerota archaeon]